MNRYERTKFDGSFSIFDTLRQAGYGERQIGEDPLPLRWLSAILNAGCRAVGNRHLVFENHATGDLLEFDGMPIRTAGAFARLRKAMPRGKWLDYPGEKRAGIAMTWHLTLPMLLAIASQSDDAEVLFVAAFIADGNAQAVIKETPKIFYIGLSPEIQVNEFDLENEYPEESFYLFPKPDISIVERDGDCISIEVKGFTCIADFEEMRPVRWDNVTDWAIDADYNGVFEPSMEFFPSGWHKKIKKLAPSASQFETLTSPLFTPGERIAVQINDGRASCHLIDLQVQRTAS